jgi:PAS domain S-box-containing protein
LVQGLDAIVWEADARTGQLTFVSQQAERLLGYPIARVLAEPDFRAWLVHPDDRERVASLWRAALTEGRDHALEYRLVAADGRLVWFHDTVRGARDAQGRVGQLRGVMVDITERKRAEEQDAKLRVAREIQQGLFPSGPPRLAGYDIGGVSYPAETTGGDYFDYVPMPGGYQGVVVGDVSGHGIGSAVLMAETRAYLRALALTRTEVGEILALLNQALAGDIVRDYFVTLLLARLDPRTHSFVYASAGHSRGYVLDRSGGVKTVLESTGRPVGIDPSDVFPASGPIALGPGDLVLLLTDGILEACAPDGTFFGAQRVLDLARVYRRHPARQIAEEIFHSIRAFSQNLPQDDDITAVVIKVEPPP